MKDSFPREVSAAWALCLCLLLFLLPCTALAEEPSWRASVDVVIVIDQSTSMMQATNDGRTPASDPDRYRLDAAALMINMLEIHASRAAVVPFNDGLYAGEPWNELLPLSITSTTNRALLTSAINRFTNVRGDTDLGAAMEKAIEILDGARREGSENQPMIFVLTDGKIDIRNPKKVSRTEDGQQVSVLYDTAYSTDLCSRMVEKAHEAGYPIYTIPLVPAGTDENSPWVAYLKTMSMRTGGSSYVVTNGAQELPTAFGNMFGDQIGSHYETIVAHPLGSNRYELALNIPNNSVKEANVIVPTANISKSGDSLDIHLYDGEGKLRNANTDPNTIFISETNHFRLYKILAPIDPGTWRLEYSLKEAAEDNYQFNLLFNYNVELVSSVDKPVAHRNEQIALSSAFYEGGTVVNDSYLYQKDNEYHGQINTQYTITAPNGAKVGPQRMDIAAGSFEAILDLTALGLQEVGVYEVQLHAEGAGLFRSDALTFEIVNRAPVAGVAADMHFDILDPVWADMNQQQEAEIVLGDYLTDQDGDTLTYAVEVSDPALVSATLNEDRGTLTIATKGAAGTAGITITASDPDGASASVAFGVTVESVLDRILARYTPQLSSSEGDDLGKGGKTTLRLVFLDAEMNNQPANDSFPYDLAAGTAVSEVTATLWEAPQMLPMVYSSEENCFTATLETAYNEAKYTMAASAIIGGRTVVTQPIEVAVGNHAPVVREAYAGGVSQTLYMDPIIGFGHLPYGAHSIDLLDVFEDPDAEPLGFAYEAPGTGDASVEVTLADSALTLTPRAAGKESVVLVATDADGAMASYTLEVEVVSMLRRVLTVAALALAALIALIILICAIRWALLPKIPLDAKIVNRTGQVLHDEASYQLPLTKKASSLTNYTDHTLLSITGGSSEAVGRAQIKPCNAHAIMFMVKDAGFSTGGVGAQAVVPLGKWTVLSSGETLTLGGTDKDFHWVLRIGGSGGGGFDLDSAGGTASFTEKPFFDEDAFGSAPAPDRNSGKKEQDGNSGSSANSNDVFF